MCLSERLISKGVGEATSCPTGMENRISIALLSLFNPQHYPTTNYHSREADERKGERRGDTASPQYAFYKMYRG